MMLKKLKKLFMKNIDDVVTSTKVNEGDIISDISEYDLDNQKEIKQIYPNNEGIGVILGFKENKCIESGRRVSHEHVRRQVPIEKQVYLLDDTFKFNQWFDKGFLCGTLHSLLKVVSIQHDYQRREVLNRWLREHDDALWKNSPTTPDEYGDNLHAGLLVVEHDENSHVDKDIARRCQYITISRIAIVETPWTHEIKKKNGEVQVECGVDRRLHVYTIPLDVDTGISLLERDRKVVATERKLDEFLG